MNELLDIISIAGNSLEIVFENGENGATLDGNVNFVYLNHISNFSVDNRLLFIVIFIENNAEIYNNFLN